MESRDKGLLLKYHAYLDWDSIYKRACVCVGKDTGMWQYQGTGTLVYNDIVGVYSPFPKVTPLSPGTRLGNCDLTAFLCLSPVCQHLDSGDKGTERTAEASGSCLPSPSPAAPAPAWGHRAAHSNCRVKRV